MGQKVNPIGFRLAVRRNWESRWFATTRDGAFARNILEDYRIREFLKEKLRQAAVPRIFIERAGPKVRVRIWTARPGVVIGRKGDELKKLREEIAVVAGKAKAEFAQALAGELKTVRDEIKKSAKSAAQSVDKVEASLEAIRAVVSEARVNPPVASAPAEIKETEEEEAVEVIEEIEEEEAAAPVAPESTAAGTGTALIVNLMIGIGNKPFVRGNGPGLSQDKGVPMSFLGIGRWQWISPDPEAPATIEVWKNDQSPLGEPLHISGGEPLEVDEGHFGGV